MDEKISSQVEKAKSMEEKTNKKRDIFLMTRNIGNENFSETSKKKKKVKTSLINLTKQEKKHLRDGG